MGTAGIIGLLGGWFGRDVVAGIRQAARERQIVSPEVMGAPEGLMRGMINFANEEIKPIIRETELATQGITTGSENDGSRFDLVREAIVTEVQSGDLAKRAEAAFPIDYIGMMVDVNPPVREQAVKVAEKLFGTAEKNKFFLEEAEAELAGALEQTLDGVTFLVRVRQRAGINTARTEDYYDLLQVSVAKKESGNPWIFTVEDWAQAPQGGESQGPKWLTKKGQRLWAEEGRVFANSATEFKPNPLLQAGNK